MGETKPKIEVLVVRKYVNTGRLIAGPIKGGAYFPLNNDLSFSSKDPHRIKRDTRLEVTSYRIECEVVPEGDGHRYQQIRHWDTRHLPKKTNDPSASLEERIDISPSEALTNEERRYAGEYSGHPLGYALIVAPVYLVWMVGVWGWYPPVVSLLSGALVVWLTRKKADPIKVLEIAEAKQRVRSFAAKEFEEAINTAEVWKALDGIGFEKAVAHLFTRQGYKVEHTPRSYDKGVDLVLRKDGRTILVQCKAYSKNVGVKDIRELHGARSQWAEADEAWVVAVHGFSKSARDFAGQNSIGLHSVMTDHLKFDLRF